MTDANQPSGAEVHPNWIKEVFVRKGYDLNDRRGRCLSNGSADIYEVLNIAGLLRDLIYDQPLYIRVNRFYCLKLQVPQWVMPQWEDVDPNVTISADYEPYCPSDPETFWQGGRWYPYSIPSYLEREQPGFVIGAQTITPGAAIRYYANVLGGRHLDGPVKKRDLSAAQMDQLLRIGQYPAIAHLLVNRVSGDILRALQPLKKAVLADPSFSAEAALIAKARRA